MSVIYTGYHLQILFTDKDGNVINVDNRTAKQKDDESRKERYCKESEKLGLKYHISRLKYRDIREIQADQKRLREEEQEETAESKAGFEFKIDFPKKKLKIEARDILKKKILY